MKSSKVDDQQQMDREDTELRLRAIVDAINDEVAAMDLVRECKDKLDRARATLENAIRRRQELAFIERRRRSMEDEASDTGVIRKRK